MGRLAAEEMLEHAGQEEALRWHLKYNHYPPIHDAFLPTAKEAIRRANADEWAHEITMPNGIVKTVASIIDGLHLDTFLDANDDY